MFNKKCLAVMTIAAATALTMGTAQAETGDTANGRVVFSGYVPGFVANGGFTVTGIGGGDDLSGGLTINADGTFASTSSVVVEGRAYDSETDEVGDLQVADWEVNSVDVSLAGASEIKSDITVTDTLTATELASTDFSTTKLAEGVDTVSISVENKTAVSDPSAIAGQDLQVAVNLLATSN